MSAPFLYSGSVLHCEDVDLARLASALSESATEAATPFYVYSKNQFVGNVEAYKKVFEGRKAIIGYALKANFNRELLRLVEAAGLSVVAVSGFEVRLALDAGFPGSRIYFNGNGKAVWELRAAIASDCFMNVDSVFNAEQLVGVAGENAHKTIRVTVRLNLDIRTEVHPYLQTATLNSKFGIVREDLAATLRLLRAASNISVVGLHCHLGSTISDVSIYTGLFKELEAICEEFKEDLKDAYIVNIGGGLGIDYKHDQAGKNLPTVRDLSLAIPLTSRFTVMLEPGRSIVGNTSALVTRVIGVKSTKAKTFVVVDASMTDMIRPALYQAYHHIVPVKQQENGSICVTVDFVGPVCESGDFLGRDRSVSAAPASGDLVAVLDTGAYGMAMASNYNLRARPAEVLVDGHKATLIGKRETYEQVALARTVNQPLL